MPVAAAHDDDRVPLSAFSDALLNCNGVFHLLSALLLHCLDQIGFWRDERANGAGQGGEDVDGGRRQQSANHEQRQRVYAFMSLPWRFEKFVRMGWCVCLDAFLFPLTVLPLRVLFMLPRLALCWRPSVRDCCDLMRFALLAACVVTLFWYDISSLYHWIRVQAPIKLYVLFNMLQVCGRKCMSALCVSLVRCITVSTCLIVFHWPCCCAVALPMQLDTQVLERMCSTFSEDLMDALYGSPSVGLGRMLVDATVSFFVLGAKTH